MNFQMLKLDLEKAEEPESNYQHLLDHRKSQRITKNIYFCFIDYAKVLDFGSQQTVENFKEMGIPDHFTWLLRNLYAGVKKQHLELDMEQQTGSRLGKEYIKVTSYIVTLLI